MYTKLHVTYKLLSNLHVAQTKLNIYFALLCTPPPWLLDYFIFADESLQPSVKVCLCLCFGVVKSVLSISESGTLLKVLGIHSYEHGNDVHKNCWFISVFKFKVDEMCEQASPIPVTLYSGHRTLLYSIYQTHIFSKGIERLCECLTSVVQVIVMYEMAFYVYCNYCRQNYHDN